jgi:glycerol-3-phosphate cytidylyltransferase-like family protein
LADRKIEDGIRDIRTRAGQAGRVAFVSGNFNVIEPGHLRLLEFAKEVGDFLVVGVSPDLSAGATVPAVLRLSGARSITMVDEVLVLPASPEDFISRLKPEFVVKGKEFENQHNPEAAIVEGYGGKLIFNSGGHTVDPVPSRAAIRSLSDAERSQALARSVWTIASSGVAGDIVEFGTMSGLTAKALARSISVLEAIIQYDRTLHLFDSFEGLPEATSEVDKRQPFVQSGAWAKGALKGLSKEALTAICAREYRADRIQTYAGWFSATVQHLPKDTRFALLHVDCDLYQSTMDALEPCLSKGWISEGAILHFDDWNTGRSSNELGERRAWRELVERHKIDFTIGGYYAEAGCWLIVHSYETA